MADSTAMTPTPLPPARAADSTAGGVFVRKSATRMSWFTVALILLLGSGVRFWIASTEQLVHRPDMVLFLRWTRGLTEHGLGGFYDKESFCDYAPLSVLMFRGVGAIGSAIWGAAPFDGQIQFLIKTPAMLADVLIAILVLIEARRLIGPRAAVLAGGLYFLNPFSIYDSAYWGQVDAVFTSLILVSLMCVARRWWPASGAFAAAAMLAKFQTIAILPIILFEAYRLGRWRAVGMLAIAGIVTFASVLAPFAFHGTAREALTRSYVNVVGQYHELSKNAYNVWHLVGSPLSADTCVPTGVTRLVAQGRIDFPANESWLLKFTWRAISLIVFSLVVAVILSLYSLRPGELNRFGAAGLLALAFFLFPTEMHERYAFPAIAFLAVWAAANAWNERLYFVMTGLLTLNIAAVQSAAALSPQIGAMNLIVFAILAVWLLIPRRAETPETAHEDPPPPSPEPILIPWFRRATLVANLVAIAFGVWLTVSAASAPAMQPSPQVRFASSLNPIVERQGWGSLGIDRSVSGGMLRLADRIYLSGLGTHAPSRIHIAVPEGATRFRAIVGIDEAARGRGSAIAIVEINRKPVFRSDALTGTGGSSDVDVVVSGVKEIVLVTEPAGDGNRSDHVNWALARFEIPAASMPATQSTSEPATQPAAPTTHP